jgi:hypothetical protein
MSIKTSPFVSVHDDGTIEIFGNPDGMPEITGVVPAPDVNTRSEKERQKRFDEACDQITLQGYVIKSKRLIRNKVFDDPGQKTTLKIVYRPCKNKSEIRKVYSEFQKVLCKRLEEHDTEYKLQSLIDNPEFLEIV